MYESPIDLYLSDIHHQILKQQDEQIYQAVVHFFPGVKREELLKALRYDRGQYEAGYADGKRDAMAELVRCKDCKHYIPNAMGKMSCSNNVWNDEFLVPTDPDDFCSYGERKEADGK